MVMDFAADPAPIKCPICDADALLCGVVDFHKSCLEEKGKRLPCLGIPIYYRWCGNCRFLFCDSFKDWGPADFARHIYNSDYLLVDPDFTHRRPTINAAVTNSLFSHAKEALSILDYGGGNGQFAEALRDMGYRAATYDPFSGFSAVPAGRADVVTAFEVIEHSNRQHETVRAILDKVKEDGLVLFSTLFLPDEFDPFGEEGLNWWYIAPRNGHISIHTRRSISLLFSLYGLTVSSLTHGLHVAHRTLPPFAEHLARG
jgi:2-polyprenyl-6-hydroxyphenyl methylase/3-demethylubiquinone-9 3-methyltransferase